MSLSTPPTAKKVTRPKPRSRGISPKTRLTLLALAVIALASIVSHVVARLLNVRTEAGTPLRFTASNPQGAGWAVGSSLPYFAIAWADLAEALKVDLTMLAVPAGSVREFEIFQQGVVPADWTIIGISSFDMNEHQISDFRAQIVPFWTEVRCLWDANVEWAQAKRVLSNYPMEIIRLGFPTAGRSDGILVQIRDRARTFFRPAQPSVPTEGTIIDQRGNDRLDNITSWSPARRDRNLSTLRSRIGGKFDYCGTKQAALIRMLQRDVASGRVIVVVVPESPVYQEHFCSGETRRKFEEALMKAQAAAPQALWIRLDQVDALQSGTNYYDLVHLNAFGQRIATAAFLDQLAIVSLK